MGVVRLGTGTGYILVGDKGHIGFYSVRLIDRCSCYISEGCFPLLSYMGSGTLGR